MSEDALIDNFRRRVHRLTVDSVTHLLKKEGFIDKYLESDEDLEKVISGPYAVISLDADSFKEINDVYGHDKGNIYLEGLSNEVDFLAWGEGDDTGFAFRGKEGDELVVILSVKDSSTKEYRARVERFKKDLEIGLRNFGSTLPTRGIERTNPSVSIGSYFRPNGLSLIMSNERLETFFGDVDGPCDKALYTAKDGKSQRGDELVGLVFYEDINNV